MQIYWSEFKYILFETIYQPEMIAWSRAGYLYKPLFVQINALHVHGYLYKPLFVQINTLPVHVL